MITLHLSPVLTLTDEVFWQLCQSNPEARLERSSKGDLILMAPVSSEGSSFNAGIVAQLWLWNQQTGAGVVFDSSAGFTLPNGAIRSPDAAWIPKARWEALTPAEKRRFAPLCPDFVMELASPNDRLSDLQAKMGEYLDNGCQLGWLIVPEAGEVEIYRPQGLPEVLPRPACLSGDPVLPGFCLDLSGLFAQA
jgi:Uma2 family endonuclease